MATTMSQSTVVMRRKPSSLTTLTTLTQGVMHLILLFLCVAALVPFLWSLLASFKLFKELNTSPDFFPKVWTLRNYQEIITRVGFPEAMRNSIIVAVVVTVCVL